MLIWGWKTNDSCNDEGIITHIGLVDSHNVSIKSGVNYESLKHNTISQNSSNFLNVCTTINTFKKPPKKPTKQKN